MTKRRIQVILLLTLFTAPCLLSAQVMADKARKAKLDEAAAVLDPAQGTLADSVKGTDDPFFTGRITVSGKMASASAGAGANAGADAADMGPDAILKGAAGLLRPTGLMMAGQRRFIVSSMGDLYEVGKPLRVTLPDGVHEVFLMAADNEGYVLKIGAITFSSKYVDHTDTGTGK